MALRSQVLSLNLPIRFVIFVLLSGCGDRDLHPVAGRVLKGREPLKPKSGYVVLKPDTLKGNSTKFEPSGVIDADGNYEVFTEQRSGAPLGWYKVIVTASGHIPKPLPNQSATRPLAKSLLSAKYGQRESTPLAIEVVANPSEGAYDLDVTQ